VPPDEELYQSTVSPVNTVAVITGITPEAQYDLSPPLTGAAITGQLQSGAVTLIVFSQPPLPVALIVTLVWAKIPVIVQTLLPELVTTPDVLVTVAPGATVTPTE
jgi:hypothetical protein